MFEIFHSKKEKKKETVQVSNIWESGNSYKRDAHTFQVTHGWFHVIEEYVHFSLITFFTALNLGGKEIIEIQTRTGKNGQNKAYALMVWDINGNVQLRRKH